MTLENQIDMIETDIKKLENITGFKTLVTKHQEINKRLTEYLSKIKEYQESLKQETSDSEESIDLDDVSFAKMIDELNELKSNALNDKPLEELLSIYQKAQKYVKLCDMYLDKQKLEIINT